MTKAKLILINGFNASGKTTIAKKYIADHSLAISIEADSIVDNIGDWINHRDEVQKLSFELTKAMIRAYLPSGHDVVLPYIVTDISEVEQFESIARECSASYYEIVLYNEKVDAVARLLERGKWGGVSSPLITEKDLPIVERDFVNMQAVIEKRGNIIRIPLKGNDPDTTYQQLLRFVEV
jgi:predicted ABC-type ATPase